MAMPNELVVVVVGACSGGLVIFSFAWSPLGPVSARVSTVIFWWSFGVQLMIVFHESAWIRGERLAVATREFQDGARAAAERCVNLSKLVGVAQSG